MPASADGPPPTSKSSNSGGNCASASTLATTPLDVDVPVPVVSVPAPDMVAASSKEASMSLWAGSSRITMIGMVVNVICTQVIPPSENMLNGEVSMNGRVLR